MKLLSFQGRAGRGTVLVTFLLCYLSTFVAALPLAQGLLDLAVPFPSNEVPDLLRPVHLPVAGAWVSLAIGIVMLLVIVIAGVAVSVRRLHDVGLTGFVVLLHPVLEAIVPDHGWPGPLPGPVDILWTIILAARPGARGPNAFGTDPREQAVPE